MLWDRAVVSPMIATTFGQLLEATVIDGPVCKTGVKRGDGRSRHCLCCRCEDKNPICYQIGTYGPEVSMVDEY